MKLFSLQRFLPPNPDVCLRMWIALFLCQGLLLSAANVLLGNLNQDEGWYLLAALRTAGGEFPYRDFLFTQGPVMPVVYGLLSPLWAPFGVLGGRLLTTLLGWLAAGCAALLARRLAPPPYRVQAGLTAWLLTACVPVHSYFTVIPKTYALASLLLLAGFFVLGGSPMRPVLSGALLGLAAATRVSLAPAIPVVLLVLWTWRADPRWNRSWLRFAAGGALALGVTYGVFLVWFREPFLFSQGYHATRSAGGAGAWLSLRAGFASRTLQAYPLLWMLAFALLLFRGAWQSLGPVRLAAWLSVGAITALHAFSPFPYDDYQTPLMPLLAVAVSAGLWQSLHSAEPRPARGAARVLAGLCGATVLLALSSPLLMEWVVIRKDRFWFESKPRPDLLVLREVGGWIHELLPPGEPLLTQDAYLAVESGRDVPRGLEMGPFSLFPELDDETARRLNVHTPRTLAQEILAGNAPVAATSGYSFALACPGTDPLEEADRALLFAALEQAYTPVRTLSNFGQAHTQLTLWIRRDVSAPAISPDN